METENTLLPWVEFLTHCKSHRRPIVGYQLGFVFAQAWGGPGERPWAVTRKGMCEQCLVDLGSDPPESAES